MDRSYKHIDQFCARWHSMLYAVAMVLLVLFSSPDLFAQGSVPDSPDVSVQSAGHWTTGASVGLGLTLHDVALGIYSEIPDCGAFTDQTSGLAFARIFVETPSLFSLPISGTVGLSIQDRSIAFSQSFRHLSRNPDGELETVTTQHRFDAQLTGMGPYLGFVWRPATSVHLGVAPGLVFMSEGETRQFEQIVSPLGATFTETDDYERPIQRGAPLAFNSSVVDLSAWLGARLPIGDRLEVLPEIGTNLLLSSLEQNTPWTSSSFYFSLGLAWKHGVGKSGSPVPDDVIAYVPPKDSEQAEIPDTTVPEIPERPLDRPDPIDTDESAPFRVEITAVGVDANNNEYPDPIIEITEAPWSQSLPLIPYIFFDERNADVPPRYLKFGAPAQADAFNLDSLVGQTPLSLHYHLLNILGQRLRSRPEVVMTIVGTTSADEGRTREERQILAERRGESVRRYLGEVWGIASQRINVIAGEPTNPSNEATAEGRAENRRAEFFFDGESLTRPVVVERLARVASPPAVKFNLDVYSSDTALIDIADWNITVRQGEKLLLMLDAASNDSLKLRNQYWSLGDMRVNRDLTPVVYRLEVTDTDGFVASASDSFTVRERVTRLPESGPTRNLSIKEFVLVGFTYNSAQLSPEHIANIYEIARVADPESWVEVTGFTDRVGDVARNRELASERAQNVADTLRAVRSRLSLPGIPISAVRGLGEAGEGLFDNNLPEGRIFSRMVRVTVNRRSP